MFATTMKQGELFIFPHGLVHFQLNLGNSNMLAFGFLNSQNPNVQVIAPALFGSQPPIRDKVLEIKFKSRCRGVYDEFIVTINKFKHGVLVTCIVTDKLFVFLLLVFLQLPHEC